MKTKNLTKEYLLEIINYLTKEIQQSTFEIHTCETCIKKEKEKLNNAKIEHDNLWTWRFKLKNSIEHKKECKQLLKKYQKIYTQKFNYQPKKVYFYCFGV